MNKKQIITSLILSFISFLATFQPTFADTKPSLSELNASLAKAQHYYEGLYTDLGNKGAVINEYYAGTKHLYTVRHGTADGIFYYDYIGDATKSAKLKKFVATYGFNPNDDLHSWMWKTDNAAGASTYSTTAYHDCGVSLPTIGNEIPYHSKVCKLGTLGVNLYIATTKIDTLLPIMTDLQAVDKGNSVDPNGIKSLEQKYNTLGFGMPICLFSHCSDVASTIRTAEFGELEMKLGKMDYADKVANDLLKAQNDKGAVYYSYDKKGNLNDKKPLLYKIIDALFNDGMVFKGTIPTNAETLNDVIAFLLQYRCTVYHVGCKTI